MNKQIMRTIEELEATQLTKPKVSVQLRQAMLETAVGKGIEIMREEWENRVTSPTTYAHAWAKIDGYRVTTRQTPTGWSIIKVS